MRRIAPAELVDRETELAALAAFCTAESGPTYRGVTTGPDAHSIASLLPGLDARVLQVEDLREALPAALRLEPRAVPVVVEALRRPRGV
ncbi:hypothetical protein ACGFYP_32840 [Streptomyces sp. NPDC048370]|uniref:hypothetical protein n=1 Tax=Streptomyces sp. NPDC048370 TaxID=3365540 RepID=UPI003718CA96